MDFGFFCVLESGCRKLLISYVSLNNFGIEFLSSKVRWDIGSQTGSAIISDP